jgi:4-hydroxy-tetrahydrodipicolinate reductase
MIEHIVVIGSGKLGKTVSENLNMTKQYTTTFLNQSHNDDSYRKTIENCDMIFDCSSNESAIKHAGYAIASNKPIVFGTSNIETKIEKLKLMFNESSSCGCHIPNFAPTFPYFVGLCQQLKHYLSMSKTPQKITSCIEETHHKLKKDKPSGSAKYLKQTLASTVDIKSIRIDNHPGKHTYMIKTPFETIEISHTVHNRSAYGVGATELVKFMSNKSGWVEYNSWLSHFNQTINN